ncbi:hypothetical protein GCM10007216_00880 [Thalassobacillus devorans]|uniref:Metallo-beta-lactamase domain-containing protein n=1 Tax=Thalassobacillus devorans TaxID=279813 RepID=A0ABQ1NE22_9BACI|nr:MBL fold metallo-hydrolase [Thalassobacillus devorans]NIK26995.1 ribonuclease BN (tRNA processing enzyme) [Thalassobacillus devorans]GGC74071.1 hypothetical protein GCM10007216_00880 [Thalassobacillus devorans]
MKVTVIGYWGAYPAVKSATSCYLFEQDNFRLLVDCGSGSMSRLQKFTDPFQLDAVLISHYHQDHIADVGVLQYAWLVQNTLQDTNRKLPIYGHPFDTAKFNSLSHQYTEGKAYDPAETLSIGPFTVKFQETNHPVPCYGMAISHGEDKVVYTADTSFSEEWIPFAEGADLLITDTNFYKGMDGAGPGHMTSEEAGAIAEKAGVHKLLLSHLPHFGEHGQLVKEAKERYEGPVSLAREGWTWKSR